MTATAAPRVTVSTRLHLAAEEAASPWGSLNPGRKSFPEVSWCLASILSHAVAAEIMDCNKPFDVRDPGYFFGSPVPARHLVNVN